jgi:hypothetical protein
LQYALSNTVLYKFESFKFVFYKYAQDKSALGILILVKFIPENKGLYRLTAVIAAAALLETEIFVLL